MCLLRVVRTIGTLYSRPSHILVYTLYLVLLLLGGYIVLGSAHTHAGIIAARERRRSETESEPEPPSQRVCRHGCGLPCAATRLGGAGGCCIAIEIDIIMIGLKQTSFWARSILAPGPARRRLPHRGSGARAARIRKHMRIAHAYPRSRSHTPPSPPPLPPSGCRCGHADPAGRLPRAANAECIIWNLRVTTIWWLGGRTDAGERFCRPCGQAQTPGTMPVPSAVVVIGIRGQVGCSRTHAGEARSPKAVRSPRGLRAPTCQSRVLGGLGGGSAGGCAASWGVGAVITGSSCDVASRRGPRAEARLDREMGLSHTCVRRWTVTATGRKG